MIRPLLPQDHQRWLELAAEVEPLFGPMVGDPGFQATLREAIAAGNALGLELDGTVVGVVGIDRAQNEITWLAVDSNRRGQGHGDRLIKAAVRTLAADREILVQTFAPEVPAGAAARRLYLANGFVDVRRAGPNPAGIETVIMRRKS